MVIKKLLLVVCCIATAAGGCAEHTIIGNTDTFHGETAPATQASIDHMATDPTVGLVYIPTLAAFSKIEAFKCGDPQKLLCMKIEVNGMGKQSILNYAQLITQVRLQDRPMAELR